MAFINLSEMEEVSVRYDRMSKDALDIVDQLNILAGNTDDQTALAKIRKARKKTEAFANNALRMSACIDEVCASYERTERMICDVYNNEEIIFPQIEFGMNYFAQLRQFEILIQIYF